MTTATATTSKTNIITGDTIRQKPISFAMDVLGVKFLDFKQAEIINSVFKGDKKRTFVESANGTGKSKVGAIVALEWLLSNKNAIVIVSAPTFYLIKDVFLRS